MVTCAPRAPRHLVLAVVKVKFSRQTDRHDFLSHLSQAREQHLAQCGTLTHLVDVNAEDTEAAAADVARRQNHAVVAPVDLAAAQVGPFFLFFFIFSSSLPWCVCWLTSQADRLIASH